MTLDEIRQQIDAADQQIRDLFLRRMELSEQVAVLKASSGDTVYKPEREKEIIERRSADVSSAYRAAYQGLVKRILEFSRSYQYRRILELQEGEKEPDCCDAAFRGDDRSGADERCLSVWLPEDGHGTLLRRTLTLIEDYGYQVTALEPSEESASSGESDPGWRIKTDASLDEPNARALRWQMCCEIPGAKETKGNTKLFAGNLTKLKKRS